jgi:hypothetical protein
MCITHHCNFIADPQRLQPWPEAIIPTTPDTVVLAAVSNHRSYTVDITAFLCISRNADTENLEPNAK